MIWNENKDETVGIERIWLNEIGKERIEYVQIVRCKDCKWRGTEACFCKAKDDVKDDWFCSEGEKQT